MTFLYCLAFAAFFFLGFELYRFLFDETKAWKGLVASLPLSCTLILLLIGLLGRITGDFASGVWVGATVAGAAGVYLALRQRSFALNWRWPIKCLDLPWLGFALLSGAAIAGLSFRYGFHDERLVQGHPALVESLLRGTYPLVFLSFPEIPNKYHIGFDILAALFSKMFRIPGYQGVDIATIFLWTALLLYLGLLLRSLGVPRKHMALASIFVVFTGGLSWWWPAAFETGARIPEWQYFHVAGRLSHFHFVFYFFQHPMAIGAFLFLGALGYLQAWIGRPDWGRLFAVILVVGALSLAHVMFFVTLLASLGLWFFGRSLRSREAFWNNAAAGAAIFFGGLAIAFALGGFFQLPSTNFSGESVRFAWPPGYLRHEFFAAGQAISLWQVFQWYLGSLGFFLIVAPVAILAAFRGKCSLLKLVAIYSTLSFFIPQALYYPFSSNVQKWFLGFEYSGKLLSAAIFLPMIGRRTWIWILTYAAVACSAVAPVRFSYDLTLRNPATWTSEQRRIAGIRHAPAEGLFLRLVEFLKSQQEAPGPIWATLGMSRALANRAGYPVLEIDNLVAMPISREKIQRRQVLLKELWQRPSEALLRELGVRWVIFTCAEHAKASVAVKDFISGLLKAPGVEDYSIQGDSSECVFVLKIPKA